MKLRHFALKYKFLIILISISFLIRLLHIFRSFEAILPYFYDDAFYYFTIAKNFSEGKGIIFNGGIPTNGFHPLYFLILVPLFKLFSLLDANLPLYVILLVLSLFDMGTGIFLYQICTCYKNTKAGILAASFWLFNPYIMQTTFLGLEVSLQVFFIAFLTYYLIKKKRINLIFRESIFIGFLIALIIYSRLDGIFICIGVILSFFIKKIQAFKRHNENITFIDIIYTLKEKDLIIITLIPFTFTFLWMIWSYLYVGTFFPISGQPSNSKFLSSSYNLSVFYSIKDSIAFIINLIFYPPENYLIQFILTLLIYGIPALLILYKWANKSDDFLKKTFRSFNFILFYIFLYFPFYWFIELRFRPWYTHISSFIVVLIYSLVITHLIEVSGNFSLKVRKKIITTEKKLYLLIFSIFSINFLYNGVVIWMHPFEFRNDARYQAALYIDNSIPTDVNIGAFNTGVVQFYTKNHDIINLDGFINPEAYYAKLNDSLQDYVIEKNIKYVVDHIGFVRSLNHTKLKLIIVEKFVMEYNSFYTETGKGIWEIYLFKVEVV